MSSHFDLWCICAAIDDLCLILENPTASNFTAVFVYKWNQRHWVMPVAGTGDGHPMVRAGVEELQLLLASDWRRLDHPDDALCIMNSEFEKEQIDALVSLHSYLIEFCDSSALERAKLKRFLSDIRDKLTSKPVTPLATKSRQRRPKRPPKKPQIPSEYRKLFDHLTTFHIECGKNRKFKTFWKWLRDQKILVSVSEDFEHWYTVTYQKAKIRYAADAKQYSEGSS